MDERVAVPTESEWQIMEVVWARHGSITSSDIVREIQQRKNISKTTVRVLIKRLVEKGLLDYIVDEHDSRVYHYAARFTREECQRRKSRDFVERYFKGSQTDAIAALVGNADLTKEQIQELYRTLDDREKKG